MNNTFQKLTPTDKVDLLVYEDAFKYIFENDDIKNVAISGPYSAGKSSLLESYKKNCKDKKFLHIYTSLFFIRPRRAGVTFPKRKVTKRTLLILRG